MTVEMSIPQSLLKLELLPVLVPLSANDALAPITHLHVPIPVVDEVLAPRLVLLLKPVLALILDAEEGKEDTEEAAACGDDECPSFAEVVWG